MSAQRTVVVIGSGISGTAAALSAAHAGANVRVIGGAPGATSLSGGAVDFVDWSSRSTPERLDESAEKAFSALDFALLPDEGVVLATTAGVVRPAAGCDRALLDLDRIGRGAVLVPRCDHPTWDAPSLARCWGSSPLAAERSVSFVALDVQLTRFKDERGIGDAEIAARHDDGARLDWLAERLREVIARNPGFVAVILPPWLGAEISRADVLSQKVGIRCGEALSGLASASGARFAAARDRAFAKAEIGYTTTWAAGARPSKSGWRIDVDDGAWVEADAVVLATGGLVGGGLVYSPGASAQAAEVPSNAYPTLRGAGDFPVKIGEHGVSPGSPSTLFGAQPESIAWPFSSDPWIERAGVITDAKGAVVGAPSGFFACGDVIANRPRTWLDSLRSGA
ncbi:MAG: FAD-binding protein, partial [Polyangiaceae bacterium]